MADLEKVAIKLGTDGPVKTQATPRLIQLLFNGVYIVKTTKAVFVWEHQYYPQLYIPSSEFTSSHLSIDHGEAYKSPTGAVVATRWTLRVGDKSIDKVVAFSPDLTGKPADLAGLVKVDFASIDRWFEEATPIFVHPKDPFKRVDILQSTREIVVRVGGVKVAETRASMHLYETGLPVRFYLPRTDIDPAVVRPSKKGTRTVCPYKGEAEYLDVVLADGRVFEDVIWFYDRPLLESAKIEGLCCFYNEKVQIELDGVALESPVTHFSKGKPNDKPSIA